MEAFAADGLSVPVHEIARRAGVGTGTVSRHFPTKEGLYGAIVATVTHRLVTQANALAANERPVPAFFAFFALMVQEGAANRGLSEALAGAGFDVEAAASSTDHDVIGTFGTLLRRAQSAGAVRRDVDVADVTGTCSLSGRCQRGWAGGMWRQLGACCDVGGPDGNSPARYVLGANDRDRALGCRRLWL
jgi:AcrR family transcriptional regulator